MWNRKYVFLGFLFLLIACNKEDSDWDKEANLFTDTSIFIQKAQVVSFSDSEIICDFEIVQLNNLESEIDYADVSLASYQPTDFTYLFSDFSVETKTPNASYSTMILMESSSYSVFDVGKASDYFSRFFEQNQHKSPQKNIALATFRSDSFVDFKIHKETDFLFGNSAEFNDSVMYDLIQNAPYSSNSYNTDLDFRDMIFAVIDSISLNPTTVGDRSIIIVDDYLNNNQGDLADDVLQEIVNKAVLNNIKINLICIDGLNYFDLAFKTGGFIIDSRESRKINQQSSKDYFSSIANGVANLDRILSTDLTTYKFRLTLNNAGQFVIASGYRSFIGLSFKGDYYQLILRMP